MAKVVVIGGGYAGLACLIELAKRAPQLDLHLIDGRSKHCKITNLHKTFVKPVTEFLVPYAELAERFGFMFHQQKINFAMADLKDWQITKKLPLVDRELPFDWLVVSTGSRPRPQPMRNEVFGLAALQSGRGPVLLEHWMNEAVNQRIELSIVGGGATGLQVLFELQEQLRRRRVDYRLRLIDIGNRLAPELPDGAHRYILRKLRREEVPFLAETEFLGQQDGKITLVDHTQAREYHLPSTATLFFPGVMRAPFALKSNAFGQVESDGQPLPDIFSAGDCADYSSDGLNQLTAQAAVRKGKLVAHNISTLYAGRRMRRYHYQEKGYLLSLGSIDAVGWVGLRFNLIKGFAAHVLKDAMEKQYDLLLDGVDTYLGFP